MRALLIIVGLLTAPQITFAAPKNFAELVNLFVSIINTAVPIVIAFAVLGFFWGLAKYISSAGDSSKIEEGRNIMIYGTIGLFVMVSLWGILRILSETFL